MLEDLYRAARAKGYPARSALAIARADSAPIRFEWSGETARTTVDGFDIVVRVRVDEYADSSWLGVFTDRYEPGAIPAPNRYAPSAFQTDAWFVPTMSVEEHRAGLSAMGYSRHLADLKAREIVREDAQRATDLTEYVVTVTAYRRGIELGSDSLGGVDIGDVFGVDAEREFEQVVDDHGMIETALDEARRALAELCQ